MRRSVLEYLCCPGCRGTLTLSATTDSFEVEDGELGCSACERTYPIRRGIPRFIRESDYTDSFGVQWNRFRTEQLDSQNGTRLSEMRFRAETGWSPEWLTGKRVIEIGCGAGRFLEIAAQDAELVIGIDASNAVDAARESLSTFTNVELLQASVYELPLKEASFDGCYCIGVVQHTPDPLRTVASLARGVRAQGVVALTCYERKPWTRLNGKYVLRPMTSRLAPETLLTLLERAMKPLFPISDVLFRLPAFGRIFRFILPIANYVEVSDLTRAQRYRWALMDTFDMLAPAFDRPQTFEAVACALREAGIANIVRLPNPGLNVIGVKAG